MDSPGIEPGSSRCKRDILPLDYKPVRDNLRFSSHNFPFKFGLLVFKFSDEITNQKITLITEMAREAISVSV